MNKIESSYEFNGQVARIILNDGKGNVLDHIMMNELIELLKAFEEKPEIKLITFEGAGKHFSFGASVEEHTREKADQMLGTFHKIFYQLMQLSIPTMAKIKGQCLGGGLELALACNFLFADKSAFFAQPEIVLGVFPPPASIMLPLKIGSARAEELLLTGKSVSAEQAEKIGLINKVFEDESQLSSESESWIKKHIIPKSSSSLKFAVKAARTTFNKELSSQLKNLENLYLNELMHTRDANEGINSFIEKRTPVWEY